MTPPAAAPAPEALLTFIVTLRRRVSKRLCGDRVIHWVAEIETPRMSVTARSIRSVDRALRNKLVRLYEWPRARADALALEFRIRGVELTTEDAVNAVEAAREEVKRAEEKLARATRDAVRELSQGTPSISVRDIGVLLGISKSIVQRLAAGLPSRVAATTLREREKEASRGPVPPLDPTIPFYENPIAARAASRPGTPSSRRSRPGAAHAKSRRRSILAGFVPRREAVVAARRQRRQRRQRRRR